MSRPIIRRTRSSIIAVALVAAVAALVPSSAGAGLLVSSATDCDEQVLSRPFAPWLDPMSYTPVAGGSFEAGSTPWTLEDGAAVVSGNESYSVAGAGDSRSLRLPAGGSATSAPICVGLDHPTLRLFTKRSGSLISALAVEVLFEDAGGHVRSLGIGVFGAASSWQPSAPLPVVANLLPLLPGELTAVSFRFTALSGDWRIDDVYVDPRHSS